MHIHYLTSHPSLLRLKQESSCWYFCVESRNTLIFIAERECESDSDFIPINGQPKALLNGSGYQYFTGHHQESYVDPATEANTQTSEQSWH